MDSDEEIILDEQSIDARWDYSKGWLGNDLDSMVMQGLPALVTP